MDLQARSITEITMEDLQRMQGVFSSGLQAKFLAEKLKLKVLSDERAQRWPNTIKALRMKRLQKKKELDNLEERKAQLCFKEKMQEAWQTQELKWQEDEKQQCEAWKEEERIKSLQNKETVNALCKARLSQARQEWERNRLQVLDRQIEEYAVKKEKMVQEREKAAASKAALKAAQHEAMIEKQNQALLATMEDTEKRFRTQRAEKEIEEDKKEKLKAERRQLDWEECDRSRKMQVHIRKMQEEDMATQERWEGEQSRTRCLEVEAECKVEETAHLLRNRVFAEYNKKAMVENMMKEKEDRASSIEEERHAVERMKEDMMNEVSLESLRL